MKQLNFYQEFLLQLQKVGYEYATAHTEFGNNIYIHDFMESGVQVICTFDVEGNLSSIQSATKPKIEKKSPDDEYYKIGEAFNILAKIWHRNKHKGI